MSPRGTARLTCAVGEAGFMEFAHIELKADDGKHEDGKEKQQPDLQQRNHGLHDGLEHHLQAWNQRTARGRSASGRGRVRAGEGQDSESLCGRSPPCKAQGPQEKRDERI